MTIGQLDIKIGADTSSFEAGAQRVEYLTNRQKASLERSAIAQNKSNDEFIAGLKRKLATLELTGTGLDRFAAQERGISVAAESVIGKIDEATARIKKMKQEVSGGIGNGFAEAEKGAIGASHATAGITRELIVLAHEASQGNFKRFGGSLLVLAEYSTKAQMAIRALVGPVGAIIGAVVIFGVAAFKGALAADELNRKLILTGNYAGVTAGSFEKLTESLSGSTGSTLRSAREALDALVSTGEVGPRMLENMGAAVVKLEKLSGKSAEEIAKDFAKMIESPTKWASESNKAYNFLSVAQYDHIKRLEEEGKKEEAAIEVLARLNEHLGAKLPESLSALGQSLKTIGHAWDAFWHAAMHGGAPETIEDRLARINKDLATNFDSNGKRVLGGAANVSSRPDEQSRATMLAERDLLLHDQLRLSENALSAATQSRYAKAGIAASDYFTKIDEERKGTTRLAKDLDELQAKIKARVEGGGPASIPEDAAREAFIRHRDRSFTDKSGENEAKKLANAIKERLNLYDVETEKLRTEGAQYVMFGKILDKTAEAMARVETASGKFAKASQKDKNAIIERAKAEDRAASFEKESKAQVEAEKRADEHTKALIKRLTDNGIATDTEIAKIKEETKYLGLNTIERQVAIKQLEIEKQLRQELADPNNAGHESEMNNSAAKRSEELAAAMRSADAEMKTFSYGSKRAFAQYSIDANNAAKFAEQYINGSLSRTEDALVNFVKTGKLSFSSLFSFMAEEFIRQNLRMALATAATGFKTGGVSGLFGAVAGLFSLGGGGATTQGGATQGMDFGGSGFPLASGTNNVPYDGMPAILHKGEAVVPAAYNPAVGGKGSGNTFDFSGQTINVGQGVSRGEVAAAVNQGNAQTEQRIRRLMRQGALAA